MAATAKQMKTFMNEVDDTIAQAQDAVVGRRR